MAATRLPELLDGRGRPRFGVKFYAVNARGEYGSASMWSGERFAVCRAGEEPRLEDCAYLYERTDT